MSTFENSWIKLQRDFVKWKWYHSSETVHLYLFLVMCANMEPSEYNNITIGRGELITSIRQLSMSTGISVRTIRTCLNRLKMSKEIRYKKLNKHGTIIIVVNYNEFQPLGVDDGMKNWIKLYRNMVNWKWSFDSKITHLYIHFLLKGQFLFLPELNKFACKLETSYLQLSRETGISVQSLRTCIKKLQDSQEICYKATSTSHKSIVTVCNYGDYSGKMLQADTEPTQNRHSTDTEQEVMVVDTIKSTEKATNL